MTAREIVLAKAARLEQGNSEGVAQRQRGGGAGRGGEVERAGFFGDTGIEMHVGLSGQRRAGVAGHGDEPRALAFDQGHDGA